MKDILDSEDKKAELNLANQGLRFINFFIDLIVLNILLIFFMAVFGLFQSGNLLVTSFLLVLMLTYYTLCEYFIGKTVGKYITKTKVVTEKGIKPSFETCLKRSISRLVLIEAFTFIAEKPVGWHDKWSKTRVIIEKVNN